jgi:hypothetical protein
MRTLTLISMVMILQGCGTDDSGQQALQTAVDTATGSQGPKGDRGPEGPAGPKGDTGDAGADGTNGTNGAKGDQGDDGQPTAVNIWVDSITEDWWLIGGGTANLPDSDPLVCGNGYRLPTSAEAIEGANHGLGPAASDLSAHVEVWTSDTPTGATYYTVTLSDGVLHGRASGTYGLFCIKPAS